MARHIRDPKLEKKGFNLQNLQKDWTKAMTQKKLFPLCSLATVKVTLANIYRIELPKLGLQRRQKLKALLVFK